MAPPLVILVLEMFGALLELVLSLLSAPETVVFTRWTTNSLPSTKATQLYFTAHPPTSVFG